MLERYSRQMLFAPIGQAGQQRLIDSRVVIVGMGALGTVLANHMVRAGVGYVRLIDRDFVEPSNLQRQMLYTEADADGSTPKAIAAADLLRRVNSAVEIEPHVADLNAANAEALLGGVDLILDGSDNFSVRFLINDAAVKLGIPWIYGGAVSSRGMMMTIIPGETPCLRCLFPQSPSQGGGDTCDTVGVLGPIIHIVASYQATEALKYLTGNKQELHGRMLQFDIWRSQDSAIDISRSRREQCPACGQHRFEYLEMDEGDDAVQSMCGRDSVQIVPRNPSPVNLAQWEEKWRPLGSVTRNPFLLKLSPNEEVTIVLFPDGRVLIQGVSDPVQAKSLYSRYIGM
ncbi:ThiF family adenylyltransferase [Paenibacillus turpanensis]|uniref:ThiF family adenylyltransferase n=1 Tax=Paenibacillus turpanensis TaxID=2689078 RepID=UPI001408156C|nr:ThiF family adenylyltransferase [Paenibacillus turpanensis]